MTSRSEDPASVENLAGISETNVAYFKPLMALN